MPKVKQPRPAKDDPHSKRLRNAIALDSVDVRAAHIRTARRAYLANVSYVDHWVGRLRGALEECAMAEDTAILFLADHGDMLGERGLWYKMSFFEWSVRIPMMLWAPSRFKPRVVSTPTSQVDVLPTLTRLAHEATGRPLPTPVDPLDGFDLVPLAESGDTDTGRCVVSEYLAEATGAPMLMIRDSRFKYTCCPGDPEQLFDLARDPDELINQASNPSEQSRIAEFRDRAAAHWDVCAVREAVLADQNRRRVLSGALRLGRYQNWDWQHMRDATQEYTRSHMELTELDITARFPRPDPFTPKQ